MRDNKTNEDVDFEVSTAYFPVGAYTVRTRGDTLLETGVHISLIFQQMAEKNYLKDDREIIYRRIGARSEDEKKAVDYVIPNYAIYEKKDGTFHFAEADVAISKAKAWVKSGKQSGFIRAKNRQLTQENYNDKPQSVKDTASRLVPAMGWTPSEDLMKRLKDIGLEGKTILSNFLASNKNTPSKTETEWENVFIKSLTPGRR
jgi:uncharacterized protein YdaU (DUF1376 family)